MTTTINNEHEKNQGRKVLNVPNKREQNQTCLDSAEREGLRQKGNVPNLRFSEFEGEWEEKRLSEIADLFKGNGISKEQLTDTGEPCILYGELYTKYKSEVIFDIFSKTDIDTRKLVKSKANDVIIPCSGETAVDIATARCVPYDNILLGGDLNIIRLYDCDGSFMSYQLNGKRKYDLAKVAQGVSVVHLYGDHLKGVKTYNPCLEEQKKIAKLLSLLDERIATQSKIIEDLKKLKCAIIEREYNGKGQECRIGDIIEQTSQRNKDNIVKTVLSVNNKLGFINQDEQFEDRTVASEDTSNYKVVTKDDFAYNPARINVGSIARLKSFDKGIVSPMYICFKVSNGIVPEYLESYFATNQFFKEMQKRLEGSVRLCLSFEGLCNIPIEVPCIAEQVETGRRIYLIDSKIETECDILFQYEKQKQYLLRQMFI